MRSTTPNPSAATRPRGEIGRLPAGMIVSGMLVSLLIAAGPTAAAAIWPLTPVEAHTELDRTRTKAVTAVCPQGQVVINGGAYINGGGPEPHTYVVLNQLIPERLADGRYGFRAWAESPQRRFDWRLHAYAMCAPAPTGYQIVSASRSASPPALGISESARVRCPTGKSMLGLGGATHRPASVEPRPGEVALEQLRLRRARGKIWAEVEAVENIDTRSPLFVWAYAVCANVDTRFIARRSSSNKTSPKNIDVVCPLGAPMYGFSASVDRGKTGGILPPGGVPLFFWARLKLTAFVPTVYNQAQVRVERRDPGEDTSSATSRPWSVTVRLICSQSLP